MAFGIIGASKQKGGSVGSSGGHNDRTRETPNADPEKKHLNRVLIGDERNVRERVSEIIEEHGGKPRRDSVEAVELVLSASHEYFLESDGSISEERVERFVEQVVKFLKDPRTLGGRCAKAPLHMDERTPHVHAHMVPIDPDGKLNCKHYLGGRAKMRALHDLYAEYMAPLGLERGREGSRARHETMKSFYASVEREVALEVDFQKIPDPPRTMLTRDSRDQYKEAVLRAVLEELEEQVQTLRHQAMLTRDERAHRVEAERRADERVAAAEERALEQVKEAESLAARAFENLQRQANWILEENKELRAGEDRLLGERNELHDALLKERRERFDFQKLARQYSDRLTDIPLVEVMEKLGYGPGERQGGHDLYRAEDAQVAMRIREQKAFDGRGQLLCRNSIDLVVHMMQQNEEQQGYTPAHALQWLAENFGERRAAGAYVVNREQAALGKFERAREQRALSDPQRSPLTPGRDSGFGGPDPGDDRTSPRDQGGYDLGR